MHQRTSNAPKKNILVAILNWGLGHAARCIPLIHELRTAGHSVILASDKRAGILLQKEFPDLPYIELPAYDIRYGSSNMLLNIAWQWPKIIFAGLHEHRKVKEIVTQFQVDIIISDSRFGCFHREVRSIFISHQLWIRTPVRLLSFIVNRVNHWIIRRFNECWIPDSPNEPRLAGDLSRPISKIPVRYIGILSRLKAKTQEENPDNHSIVAILSGPEPQRTRFEQLLIDQAKSLEQAMLLIQGKTEEQAVERQEGPITIRPFASGAELIPILLKVDIVLCRAGYSSIMDLVSLGKRAVLVPTPGQTEQEYLAKVCHSKGWFYSQTQDEFDLQKALVSARNYGPNAKMRGVVNHHEYLKSAVRSLSS